MKVGIIAANNTRYSPYIFFYTEILEQIKAEYEIIVPDRNPGMDKDQGNVRVLEWKQGQKTLVSYLLYCQSVKNLVKKNRYDALVVLTGNNAAFLGPWLKRKYAGRYIVDIRDYTHEDISLYYKREQMAVKNSLLNVLSSDKFRSFLPEAEYVVCHNLTVKEILDTKFEKAEGRPVDIGYVGALSYPGQCKRMMALVKEDPRFSLSFYGTSNLEPALRAYAETLDCDRIRFFGGYTNSEKAEIIKKVDVLFNAYGNGCPLLDYAVSNKMYDAMAFKKPIITCPDTYMDELAGPMSYPIDLEKETSLDALYAWYNNLTPEIVDSYADKMHRRFLEESQETSNIVKEKLISLQK